MLDGFEANPAYTSVRFEARNMSFLRAPSSFASAGLTTGAPAETNIVRLAKPDRYPESISMPQPR